MELRGLHNSQCLRVQDQIPHLMVTDRIPAEEKIIWAHYFSAGGDWYVAELGEPGDDASTEVFGYMKLAAFPDGAEWGYFGLEGLEQVKAMGGLVIVDRRARLLVEAVPVL